MIKKTPLRSPEGPRGEAADSFPIPARTNLLIVGVQLLAIATCLVGLRDFADGWRLAGWAVAFAVVMNSVYAMIHEAEHGVLHPHPSVNEAAGVLLALFFPAPYHLIRQGHIGHHLRNRSDDEAFDLWFEGENRWAKCLQWYSILTGLFWVSIVFSNLAVLLFPKLLDEKLYRFDRPSFALFASLSPAYWRLIRLEAALVIALHASLVLALDVPLWRYATMYFAFGFSWSALQYLHHYGTERHVTRGARNVFLFPLLDWILLHHNWHLTHHKHPTVPWRYLPRLGHREDPERTFLLWHYFKMWKPPKRAQESVENRYAGQVIR